MVKEKRILSYFIGWLLLGYIILFIGVSKVFASTYTGFNYTAQLYDNLGPTLNSVTTSGPTAGTGYYEGYVGFTAYTSGAAWGISSPTPLIANHTYTLTAQIINECSQPILSSYNRIGVGTSLSNAVTSYQNNTNVNEVYSKALSGNQYLIQFAFTPTINSSYIVFPFATSQTCSSSRVFLNNISMEDLGETSVTEEQINNSLNNQTAEINTSIQNSTDTITGEINDMEQSIIDSNKETQDVIKDQFNTCRDSTNLFNANLISSDSGIIVSEKGKIITMPLNTTNNGYTLTRKKLRELAPDLKVGDVVYLYFDLSYNSRNTYIYLSIGEMLWNRNYSKTITEDMLNSQVALYANNFTAGETEQLIISNFRMVKNSSDKWEPYGEEICSNKIDETNDKLDGIQGALTDSSAPNTSGLENSAGWLPAGPLDSILNLPLTMLNSLTNSLGKTCSPLNLTLPYVNKNIQIPCLSTIFAQITGVNSLWTWVGTIASVLILYNYLLNLYAWVDRVLTLRAEFDEAMGADLANWGRL